MAVSQAQCSFLNKFGSSFEQGTKFVAVLGLLLSPVFYRLDLLWSSVAKLKSFKSKTKWINVAVIVNLELGLLYFWFLFYV